MLLANTPMPVLVCIQPCNEIHAYSVRCIFFWCGSFCALPFLHVAYTNLVGCAGSFVYSYHGTLMKLLLLKSRYADAHC